MTAEQREPQPLGEASESELREELARTEQQLSELRDQIDEQRAAVGDTARDVVDQADTAAMIQQADQTEQILASVQQRRDWLRQRLDELA